MLVNTIFRTYINAVCFDDSSKVMNNRYEEYVLSVGDFDERIFLGEDAEDEIGTPGKASADLAEEMEMKKKSLKDHFDEVSDTLVY